MLLVNKKLSMSLLVALCLFFGASPAYAYLDPGTGSIVLQMLVAGMLSAAFTIKIYWYKIKSKVLKILGKEPMASESNLRDGENSDKTT